MKKNNIILLLLLCIGSLLSQSCNKVDKKEADNPKDNSGALSLMSEMFFSDEVQDFTLVVSSTHGVGLFENNPLTKSSVSVQAFSKDNSNVGKVSVGGYDIPFTDKTYFLATDTTISPLVFTGKNINLTLTGSSLPSFNFSKYSPAITNLTYTGLVDNKLPKNSNLTVSWTADSKMDTAGKSGILLYAEDFNNGKSDYIYKDVNDGDGTITLSASELSKLSSYESIAVYYIKGIDQIETVQGKTIEFEFINFSWSRIYYVN